MAEDRQPQALALTGGATSTTSASAPCSPGLWKLLTEGEDGGSAIRIIALNPTLRAECERVTGSIVALASRMPDEDAQAQALMAVLVRHAPGFGVQAKGADEWAAIFDGYLETLWDMPAMAIEEAFSRWKRNELYPKDIGRHAFYPKANELFALAGPFWHKLRTAAWRSKRALEKIEAEAPKMTADERAANSAKIRELMTQPRERFPPQPPGITLKDWVAHCRANGLVEIGEPQGPDTAPKISPQQMAERIRAAASPASQGDIGEII